MKSEKLSVRLEMGEYGWAYLHLALAGQAVTIRLSQVFDPFDDIIAWSRKIDGGDIPVRMEIDEEGSVMVLSTLRANDPDRVLFRVSEKDDQKIHLEGIVSRPRLAAYLRQEIRRFFESDFDPQHWDQQHPEQYDEEGYVPTKQRVLGDSWLAKSTHPKT